ncbi:TetR/AcrR family transcriptional regulator [Pseudonocardia sp. GCM10023141]|uniref:TetR/AcrR family transcriptional regulator n=1 Tax=Pseudonocardia sp. GCM10023141 TaxID=3252653 RepID=UPI00360A0B21
MPRPQTVHDDELFDRLAQVFRIAGFEGASLGALAQGAQLQRASLYHRFPDGKTQMAEAVMRRVRVLFEHAVEPMASDPDVTAGVIETGRRLSTIYGDGELACVLDTLTLSGAPESVRAIAADVTNVWIGGMAGAAMRGGATPEAARIAAEDAFAQLEGGLVLGRLLGDPATFRRAIDALPRLLLG